jgi:hypothetical protein
MAEHSERARYVTEQVALWIANDGDYIERARDWARSGPLYLQRRLRGVIEAAEEGTPPWHVAQELAPNDFDRVRWRDVAEEIQEEE